MNIEEAVLYFGSKAKIARVLHISKAAVSKWKYKIPPRRVYELKEMMAKGNLKEDQKNDY